jgi:hypothetical protein
LAKGQAYPSWSWLKLASATLDAEVL